MVGGMNGKCPKRIRKPKEAHHVDAAHEVALTIDGRQVVSKFRNGSVLFADGPVPFSVAEELVADLMERYRRYAAGAVG